MIILSKPDGYSFYLIQIDKIFFLPSRIQVKSKGKNLGYGLVKDTFLP